MTCRIYIYTKIKEYNYLYKRTIFIYITKFYLDRRRVSIAHRICIIKVKEYNYLCKRTVYTYTTKFYMENRSRG